MLETNIKPAFNQEWRVREFRRPDGGGPLNERESISSVNAFAIDRITGETVTGMVTNAAPCNYTQVRYFFSGGTPAQTVIVVIQIVTSNGQQLEDRKQFTII